MAARCRKSKLTFPALVMVLLVGIAGYFVNSQGGFDDFFSSMETPAQAAPQGTVDGAAQVYFLDVGQGDSELIQLPDGKTVLIDAGTRATAEELSAQLGAMGVEKIDYLIATHPHEDHIGGMAQIVTDFEIGKIYAPKVADSQTPTTKVYENFLTAVSEKGLKITAAKGGDVIFDENGAKLEVFAPNSDRYSDLNSYSIVAKFTYGETSFLFTGDAEADSEQEMVDMGYALKSDVLKCGHHGSETSTSAAFLSAVAPEAAVISCGAGNDYGHPHEKTLTALEDAGVTIYRTDEQGTILAESDGQEVTFQTN